MHLPAADAAERCIMPAFNLRWCLFGKRFGDLLRHSFYGSFYIMRGTRDSQRGVGSTARCHRTAGELVYEVDCYDSFFGADAHTIFDQQKFFLLTG